MDYLKNFTSFLVIFVAVSLFTAGNAFAQGEGQGQGQGLINNTGLTNGQGFTTGVGHLNGTSAVSDPCLSAAIDDAVASIERDIQSTVLEVTIVDSDTFTVLYDDGSGTCFLIHARVVVSDTCLATFVRIDKVDCP